MRTKTLAMAAVLLLSLGFTSGAQAQQYEAYFEDDPLHDGMDKLCIDGTMTCTDTASNGNVEGLYGTLTIYQRNSFGDNPNYYVQYGQQGNANLKWCPVDYSKGKTRIKVRLHISPSGSDRVFVNQVLVNYAASDPTTTVPPGTCVNISNIDMGLFSPKEMLFLWDSNGDAESGGRNMIDLLRGSCTWRKIKGKWYCL
jgi:hypothetical protein